MHSSRMRITRLLPVSPSMHCSREGGVPGPGGVPGGVPGSEGCTWSRGMYLVQVGMCLVWGVYLVPQGVYLVPWGVYLVLGVGCTWFRRGVYLVWRGVYLVPGGFTWLQRGTWSGGVGTPPPRTEFLTHASENITLPQT